MGQISRALKGSFAALLLVLGIALSSLLPTPRVARTGVGGPERASLMPQNTRMTVALLGTPVLAVGGFIYAVMKLKALAATPDSVFGAYLITALLLGAAGVRHWHAGRQARSNP